MCNVAMRNWYPICVRNIEGHFATQHTVIYWNLHANEHTICSRALLYGLQNADFIARSWKVSFNFLSMFFTNILFSFVSYVKACKFSKHGFTYLHVLQTNMDFGSNANIFFLSEQNFNLSFWVRPLHTAIFHFSMTSM